MELDSQPPPATEDLSASTSTARTHESEPKARRALPSHQFTWNLTGGSWFGPFSIKKRTPERQVPQGNWSKPGSPERQVPCELKAGYLLYSNSAIQGCGN